MQSPPARRCVLRNTDCFFCHRSYGTDAPGGPLTPVALACGHDVCETCSRQVGSTCPYCVTPLNRLPTHKLKVEFIDVPAASENESGGQDGQHSLDDFARTIHTAVAQHGDLGQSGSYRDVRNAAQSLAGMRLPGGTSAEVTRLVSALVGGIEKLCIALEIKENCQQFDAWSPGARAEHEAAAAAHVRGNRNRETAPEPARPSTGTRRGQAAAAQGASPPQQTGRAPRAPRDARPAAPSTNPSRRSSASQAAPPDTVSSDSDSEAPSSTTDREENRHSVPPPNNRGRNNPNNDHIQSRTRNRNREPAPQLRRCKGTTLRGERCRLQVLGQDYCHFHGPRDPDNDTEDESVPNRCHGRTLRGLRCKKLTVGGDYCEYHDETLGNYPGRCRGISSRGMQCRLRAQNGSYCEYHAR